MNAPSDAPFHLSLLGQFSLTGPQGPVDLGNNKKLCALLAFMACATSGPPSRETLTALLWDSGFDMQARHSLRQALTRLRRALGQDVFVSIDDTLAIHPGLFHCDAVSFESLIHADAREARSAAVDLYQGAFLAGVAIPEKAWIDWANAQRQRLQDLAINGLIRLGEEEMLRDPVKALTFARRAVAIDSLREDAHRLILRALEAAGRRDDALEHYDTLSARFRHDLNIELDASTAGIVTTPAPPVKAAAMPPAPSPMSVLHGILPSVAVLPFRNLTGDPSADRFADGIVEDIIVSLASMREMMVISRTATSDFRGHHVDPREVGRALGVRYILEGSVRKSGMSARVATQLCDTETGTSVWSGWQEVSLNDLFEAQDRIAREVIAGVIPNVQTAELRRAQQIRPTSFTAYDHLLHAQNAVNRLGRQRLLGARDHLDRAMEAHPEFAVTAARAAFWYILWIGQGWSDNPQDDARKAAALARKAIDLDGRNALALATYGHLRSFLFHDYDSALVYFDRALSACPNSSWAWALSSVTLSYIGRSSDAVHRAEHGLRLSPHDRNLFLYYTPLSIAHYSNGNYENAVKWGRMSVAENPTFSACYRYLVSALTAAGRLDDAHEVASTFLKLEPDFRLEQYDRTLQPFLRPEIKTQHLEHLRRAGLPL